MGPWAVTFYLNSRSHWGSHTRHSSLKFFAFLKILSSYGLQTSKIILFLCIFSRHVFLLRPVCYEQKHIFSTNDPSLGCILQPIIYTCWRRQLAILQGRRYKVKERVVLILLSALKLPFISPLTTTWTKAAFARNSALTWRKVIRKSIKILKKDKTRIRTSSRLPTRKLHHFSYMSSDSIPLSLFLSEPKLFQDPSSFSRTSSLGPRNASKEALFLGLTALCTS